MLDIQLRNVRQTRPEPGWVWVGGAFERFEPSPLANPFPSILENGSESPGNACACYHGWVHDQLAAGDVAVRTELNRLYQLACAGPLVLACTCAPQPCHAEIIVGLIKRAYAKRHPAGSQPRREALTPAPAAISADDSDRINDVLPIFREHHRDVRRGT